MKKISMICIGICMIILLSAGCLNGPGPEAAPVTPTTQMATPLPTPTATLPPPEPILVKDPDIFGTKITLRGEAAPDNSGLIVALDFDATNAMGVSSSQGNSLLITLFAYNLDAVPEGFSPQTSDEVKLANIPYKTKRDTIFSMNIKTIAADFPRDSENKNLDISKPYNYGAIVDKEN